MLVQAAMVAEVRKLVRKLGVEDPPPLFGAKKGLKIPAPSAGLRRKLLPRAAAPGIKGAT